MAGVQCSLQLLHRDAGKLTRWESELQVKACLFLNELSFLSPTVSQKGRRGPRSPVQCGVPGGSTPPLSALRPFLEREVTLFGKRVVADVVSEDEV